MDEPHELKLNERLVVMVAPKSEGEAVQEDDDWKFWNALSQQVMQDAYGADELEYTLDMLREVNPDYAPQNWTEKVQETKHETGPHGRLWNAKLHDSTHYH